MVVLNPHIRPPLFTLVFNSNVSRPTSTQCSEMYCMHKARNISDILNMSSLTWHLYAIAYVLRPCIYFIHATGYRYVAEKESARFALPDKNNIYSGTWEFGTPKGLWKPVLNSEVVLFLRSISMYWIGLGTEVVVLNSQVVPISQVVLKAGFTVYNSENEQHQQQRPV